MARIQSFTDRFNIDHPSAFWTDEITIKTQSRQIVIRSWAYHDRQSFDDGFEAIGHKTYVLEQTDYDDFISGHVGGNNHVLDSVDARLRNIDSFWNSSQKVDHPLT